VQPCEMIFQDLKSEKLIVAKGLLFVLLGCASAALIVIESGAWWRRLMLLAVCIWAFCRAYYFAFYVLEHYVNGNFKFSGLMSAIRYLGSRSGREEPSKTASPDSDKGHSR